MDATRMARDKIPETNMNKQHDMLVDNDKTSLGVLRRLGLEGRKEAGHDYNPALHGTLAGSTVYDHRKMYVSQDEMARWRVPIAFRDFCAHKYIEYMKCVKDTYHCPWKCWDVHHEMEHCMTQENAERIVAARKFRGEL
ncbi:uncharacterized protein LOC135816200 [Sycon ciliatum]|uniref:uncharacterized protein LOC135816200 n=1 Tax=Sycon ciliatum TaxID=27933 RepID=UPI0020AD0EEB|eukprot:scpid98722/ scgid10147/ NADH dehydrogenase [ubiquinone] 1 beta subcomplex subunit 7